MAELGELGDQVGEDVVEVGGIDWDGEEEGCAGDGGGWVGFEGDGCQDAEC